MPQYFDVDPTAYYPNPERYARALHEPLDCRSILDCGAGHGGVFDCAHWTDRPGMTQRVATDLFWIRDMPDGWKKLTNVDVTDLWMFADGQFDYVQCLEVLEHVPDSRKALEELVRVARKMVFITSADEMHHRGEEQERIEKINPHQAYIKQPSIADLRELGFEVRVEELERRQIVAWLIKS